MVQAGYEIGYEALMLDQKQNVCFIETMSISLKSMLLFYSINQCCNEDWKWTEDEYEDSLVSVNRPKTNTKNLR